MTFENLEVSFKYHDLRHRIKIPTDYNTIDNLPYDLASVFEEIIEKSEVNPDIVIEQLAVRFDFGSHPDKGDEE